ncbi:MAG: hypothetical protein JWR35_295 [Marmoricola sp.]|nr:hypothetical protein [Marmoricola sp.]
MTSDDEVLRLRAQVAQAKLDALQAKLAAAEAGSTTTDTSTPSEGGLPKYAFDLADFVRKAAPEAAPEAAVDTTLSAVPRHVPMTYKLLLLPFSWWAIFTIFMISVAPIIVWIGIPEFGMVAVVLTVLGVVGVRLRRHVRQLGLLRWGEVATRLQESVEDVGTYYSGVTYQNMRVPIAHGWDVDRGFYNGPGTKSKVRYSLNGTEGELTIRGRGGESGVILANTRKPHIAYNVSSFPYDLKRTSTGDWTGEVGTKLVVGSLTMTVILVGWAVGAEIVLNIVRGLTPQLFG